MTEILYQAANPPFPAGVNYARGTPGVATADSYPALDWLRIVLASIVALGHEGVRFPGPIDGGLAVEVFFALSGWLIGNILLKTGRDDLPKFYFNRATRIWIPYATAVLVLYGFAAAYKGIDIFWFKYLFFDTTFTHQVFTHFPRASSELPLEGSGNQFWSISVEEQFYLIAPAIMLLPLGRRLVVWVPIAFGLIFAHVLGSAIALGVIAAIAHRHAPNWHLKPVARVAMLVASAILLAALFAGAPWFLRPVFAISVVLALAVPGARTPLSVFFGGISYPVYLNHWIGSFVAHGVTKHVLRFADETGTAKLVFVALAYLASLLVGAVAYSLIDRQVLARRGKWFSRRRGIACAAVAYTLVAVGLAFGGLFP